LLSATENINISLFCSTYPKLSCCILGLHFWHIYKFEKGIPG